MNSKNSGEAPESSSVRERRLVILATGGTIAGKAPDPGKPTQYAAAQIGGEALKEVLQDTAAHRLKAGDWTVEVEQVAQIDSKDMGESVWRKLLSATSRHLARTEVAAILITHGTDTLEETAYLLHRALAGAKPVVLTAAMRPANAVSADGPANLLDALAVCLHDGARGVCVALDGRVWHPAELRKQHSHRLDAFSAGDAGPLALVQNGDLVQLRAWPEPGDMKLELLLGTRSAWPRVALLSSHADVDGDLLQALPSLGYQGAIVAATGNGTVHERLLSAARSLVQQGFPIVRASRCAVGGIVGTDNSDEALPSAGSLGPAQARLALMLSLLAGRPFRA